MTDREARLARLPRYDLAKDHHGRPYGVPCDDGAWVRLADLDAALSTPPEAPPEPERDLRWTLDNIYAIARRKAHPRLQDAWSDVLRLCEQAGCAPRGVLHDNGGSVNGD